VSFIIFTASVRNILDTTSYFRLALNLLTCTIVAPPSNASKWQMGFNLAFKGLNRFNDNYSSYMCKLLIEGNNYVYKACNPKS
jgi:hypothetical protein